MTFLSRSRRGLAAATFTATLIAAGCGTGNNGLPAAIEVELPDGTTVTVDAGGGAAKLADSTWDFTNTSGVGQGIPFVRIRFGENGNLSQFENSLLTQDVFGDDVVFDGRRRATRQKGLEYAASTFGAQTGDGAGFSFEGRLTAFFAGIQVGVGTATASGTFDPDDPDTMTGTFTFVSSLTVPIEIPNAEQDLEFSFVARRIVE